jgi:hypothetical protein
MLSKSISLRSTDGHVGRGIRANGTGASTPARLYGPNLRDDTAIESSRLEGLLLGLADPY